MAKRKPKYTAGLERLRKVLELYSHIPVKTPCTHYAFEFVFMTLWLTATEGVPLTDWRIQEKRRFYMWDRDWL